MKILKGNRFINNTIMQYLMTLANYIFPLITFPYLTRVLEPNMYGIVTYMTATVSYFGMFIDFGFNLSATKQIAENQKDKKFIGEVLGTVIQAKLILALCSLIIFTAMIPFVAILRENILLGYLYLVAILLSLWLPDFMFRGIERMEIITVRFIISKTITTALIFILVHSASDVIWLPVLNIMGTLVAIYLTWYEIKKRLKIQVYYSTIKASLTALKVSSIYFISNFATTAFGATNAFMLGVMSLPAAHIGYWGVSYVLISSAQAMYSPIAVSLYPHMVARKDFKLVRKILLLFMPPIVIATAVVYILAEPIIVLISGSEYDGAVSVFRAMLPVLLCSFPAMIIGFPVLGAIGKVKETTTTTVISSLFHIIGLLLLAFMGQFTVLNVAILRSLTEAVLLVSRVYILIMYRRDFSQCH